MPPEATNDTRRESPVLYSTSPPTAQLLESLYRQEVLQARRMPPEEKLLAGEQLFEWACEIALAGIRHQCPQYSEAQCREALGKRLALRRKIEGRV